MQRKNCAITSLNNVIIYVEYPEEATKKLRLTSELARLHGT